MAIYPQQINEWLESQFPRDQKVRPEDVKFQGIEINASGELINIPVIYGRRRITPPRVFASVKSNNSNILYAVYAVSEGPITSYDKLFINDIQVGITSTGGLLPIGSGLYGGKLTVDLKLGNASGNNSSLFDEITGVASDFTSLKNSLAGMAYIVLKMTYTADGPFQEMPKVSLDICGRKLRNSSSIGAEQNVYENANPADVMLDLLTNTRYGQGLADSKIDTTSISTLRSYFNQTLQSYIGGPYIKRGQVNWIMNTGNTVLTNVNELCRQFGMYMTYVNGKYRFQYDGISPTYVMQITSSQVIGGYTYSVPDLTNKYNRVNVVFPDIDNDFQETVATYEDTTHQTDDGEVLEVNMNFDAITNFYLARFAAENLERRSRVERVFRWKMTPAALQFQVGDIVQYIGLIRIVNMTMNDDMTFDVEGIRYDSTVYPPFQLKSKNPIRPEIKPTPPGAIQPAPTPPITPDVPTPVLPPVEIPRPAEETARKITISSIGESYTLSDGLGSDFYLFPVQKTANFTTSVADTNYITQTAIYSKVYHSYGQDIRVMKYEQGTSADYFYIYKSYVSNRNRDLANISLGGEGLTILKTQSYDRIFFVYEIEPGQWGVISKLPGSTGKLEINRFDPETQSTVNGQFGLSINIFTLNDVIYSQAERPSSSSYYGFPVLRFDSNSNYYTTDSIDGLRYYLSYSTYAGQRWMIPNSIWSTRQNYSITTAGARMKIKMFVVNESGESIYLGYQNLNLHANMPAQFGLTAITATSRTNYFAGTKTTAPF